MIRAAALALVMLSLGLSLTTAGGAAPAPVNVKVELSYRTLGGSYDDVHIRISRQGRVRYAGLVKEIAGDSTRRPVLRTRNLGGGEPVVILDYDTGGAYCCTWSIFYVYVPATDRYRPVDVNWGSFAYRLVDIGRDGKWEFVSADLRLDGYFTPHVISSAPIRIFRFQAGRLVDVTRLFPARIRSDLAAARKTFLDARRSGADDLRGVIVAYAADLCLLGRCGEARRLVADAQARGELSRGATGPRGGAYVEQLFALLRRTGYVPV